MTPAVSKVVIINTGFVKGENYRKFEYFEIKFQQKRQTL
jgi:hypothetical protein